MRFPDTHSKLISLVLSSWILTVLWEEQRKKVLVKANNIFMIADDVVYGPRGRRETKWKWKTAWNFEYLNPLSPNSDQHQFSPNNIHTLSRDKVMRINKMIIIEKIPWSFIKFSLLILKGNVWRSVWRICMWYQGLKGLCHATCYLFKKQNLFLQQLKSKNNDLVLLFFETYI